MRGSVTPFTLPFEKGKKLTVVYGENGTGKSTICDAFEFLGNGKVGSLENRGLGRPNKYWHSLGKTAADVAVSLEYLDNITCRARILRSDVIADPPESRPRVEVLRRSQILDLVEANPGNRYNAISRFIDVSGVETSEASLRQLTRDLAGSRDFAIARVMENQDAIRQFWEAAGSPGKDPLDWAINETNRDAGAAEPEIAALVRLQYCYSRLGDYPGILMAAQDDIRAAEGVAKETRLKAKECVQSIAADAEEVIGVLQSASTYLHKHPTLSVCPLCESSEKVQGLHQRITERLDSFSALRSAQQKTIAAEAVVQRATHKLDSIQDNAKKQAEEFNNTISSFHGLLTCLCQRRKHRLTSNLLGHGSRKRSHLPECLEKSGNNQAG